MREKGNTVIGEQLVAAAMSPYTFQTCDSGLISEVPAACSSTLGRDRRLKIFCLAFCCMIALIFQARESTWIFSHLYTQDM